MLNKNKLPFILFNAVILCAGIFYFFSLCSEKIHLEEIGPLYLMYKEYPKMSQFGEDTEKKRKKVDKDFALLGIQPKKYYFAFYNHPGVIPNEQKRIERGVILDVEEYNLARRALTEYKARKLDKITSIVTQLDNSTGNKNNLQASFSEMYRYALLKNLSVQYSLIIFDSEKNVLFLNVLVVSE